MKFNFTDKAILKGTRLTADGYLIAVAYAVRTGIQLYAGHEVGMEDKKVVRVYRSEDEVKSPKSLASFSHAPITLNHPTEKVTADNWKDLAVGEVSTEATWEDDKIKLPLILKDARAIKALIDGKRELSAGYSCNLEFIDGTTPDGQHYNAIQKDIVINHLAIVDKGRAGDGCKIGDNLINDEENIMSETQKKTVVLGDTAVTVELDQALLIEKFKTDQVKILADIQVEHEKLIDAEDAKMAKKDGEIKKLQDESLDSAGIDKLVAARTKLLDCAKLIDKDVKIEGLSDAEIRRAVVIATLGADAIKDKSDVYIDARFEILSEDIEDTEKKANVKIVLATKGQVTDIYAQRDEDLSSAWKVNQKKEG